MKLFAVLLVVIIGMASAQPQRPSYAGSRPVGYPELANRFKDPNATEEPVTQTNLNNRIGEDGSTIFTPVDARGDAYLVDRLNQWPREHRPFWLLNAGSIEAARNPAANPQQPLQNPLENRNSFQGNVPETLTIKPTHHRNTFLSSSINNNN